MATLNYKCPNCDGPLKFNPDQQKFTCEYCLSVFEAEKIQQMFEQAEQKVTSDEREVNRQKQQQAEAKAQGVDTSGDYPVAYTCPSCGAEVVTTESTAATTCFYCQNPVVLGGRLSGEFAPDRVVPFALTKEKAIDKFSEMCGKKWFLPKGFLDKRRFEHMNGVYFPYWFVDQQKQAHMEATGEKVRTWTTGRKEYTETKVYRVVRGGDVVIKNVFERALKSEDRDMLQSVHPYDLAQAKKFAMSYLSGFQAEKRDIERAEIDDMMQKRMLNYTKEALKSTMSEYTNIRDENLSAKTELESWNYTLLPVWIMTYKFNGQIIPFSINGQTGKTYGPLPVAKGKLALFAAIVAVVVILIGLLGGMLF